MPKQQKDSSRKLVHKALDDFTQAWTYAENNYHDTWERSWKLWNNTRTDVAYNGVSDTFVPMVFSTIETMVASLGGGRPRFDFRPATPEQENDTKVLNNLLDYYWDKDKWQATVDKWLRSMLLYGTGVMFVWWDIDCPRLDIIPLRDFFIDPTASTPEDARYMGRRYLTTKEQLEDMEFFDVETGKMKKVYKNLKKIPVGSTDANEMDKEEKDILLGSTLGKDARQNQVEIIEHWTRDKIVVIANRATVIREDENPHKTAAKLRGRDNPQGIFPFIIQRDYVDESLVYGKGEVEPIAGLQESLNDLTNQNRDAITFTLNPMYTLDPKYSDYINEIESTPGNVYPFEANALVPIQLGNVPVDAFNERQLIKTEIREITAVDLVAKGVASSQANTATEVVSQLQAAATRLDVKVSQIENEGFYDLAKVVLDLTQLYITEPMAVRIIGNRKGVDWALFDPQVFIGEYEPKVSLEATLNAEKEANTQQAQDIFLAFRDDPMVNQEELRRMVFAKGFGLDADEVERLMDVQPLPEEGLGQQLAPLNPQLDVGVGDIQGLQGLF